MENLETKKQEGRRLSTRESELPVVASNGRHPRTLREVVTPAGRLSHARQSKTAGPPECISIFGGSVVPRCSIRSAIRPRSNNPAVHIDGQTPIPDPDHPRPISQIRRAAPGSPSADTHGSLYCRIHVAHPVRKT